jgi:hypothetical protein
VPGRGGGWTARRGVRGGQLPGGAAAAAATVMARRRATPATAASSSRGLALEDDRGEPPGDGAQRGAGPPVACELDDEVDDLRRGIDHRHAGHRRDEVAQRLPELRDEREDRRGVGEGGRALPQRLGRARRGGRGCRCLLQEETGKHRGAVRRAMG